MDYYAVYYNNQNLKHHGVLGQRWGKRRYQNADGTLTSAGKKRYGYYDKKLAKANAAVESKSTKLSYKAEKYEKKAVNAAMKANKKIFTTKVAKAKNAAKSVKYEAKAAKYRTKNSKLLDKQQSRQAVINNMARKLGMSTNTLDSLAKSTKNTYSTEAKTYLKTVSNQNKYISAYKKYLNDRTETNKASSDAALNAFKSSARDNAYYTDHSTERAMNNQYNKTIRSAKNKARIDYVLGK